MKNKILQMSLLVIGIMLMASMANAQKLLDYTIDKKYDQAYTPIAGNRLANQPYGWNYYWIYEYDSRLGGFQFKYDDRVWNRFGINGGGFISLFNSTMPYPYTCGSYSYPYTWIPYYFYSPHDIYNNMCANRPALYPFYGYYASYYNANIPGEINFEVRGTAPDRVLIVEWKNVSPYDFYSYPSTAYRNFQCWMYENGVVEYKYGPMYFPDSYAYDYYNGGSYWYGYVWFSVGFTGCDWVTSQDGQYSYYSYINIYAKENGQELVPHYSNKNYLPWYAMPALRNPETQFPDAQHVGVIRNGLVITLSAYPSLVDVYPKNGVILKRGEVHTDDKHPAAFFDRNNSSMPEVYTKYSISGPLPKSNPLYRTIYTGTKINNTNDEIIYFPNQPVGKSQRRNIPFAKGIAARQSDGALDLLTNQDQIPGGEYMVEAQMILYNPNTGGILITQNMKPQIFIIANDNDLAVSELIAPKHRFDKKYPINAAPVPVQVRMVNVGVNNITNFTVNVQIWYEDGTREYNQSMYWPQNPSYLVTGQSTTLIFPSYTPRRIGKYKLVVSSTLDNARDDDLKNNRFPRVDAEDFYFEVAHEFEGQVFSINKPKGEIYVDRPVRPAAIYQNNGVSDMSEIPAKCVINDPDGNKIYEDNVVIQDIQSGQFNQRLVNFNADFIPTRLGRYQVCFSMDYEDDPISGNDQLCEYFDVVGAMNGTYTIGLANDGQNRNFRTVQAAVDALFTRGVSGHVIFELTDASYNVGTKFGDIGYVANVPALDMRSKIIGAGPNATITFKPSKVRSVFRGGVTLNLLSDIGIGVYFGTSIEPNNNNAAVRGVHVNNIFKYAKSDGYIAFDGGVNKSFRFKLESKSDFRAPFYLSDGARNITIQNSLIENADPGNISYANTLPHFKYNSANNKYEFEEDIKADKSTYSAGVLMRSKPPMYLVTKDNTFRVDTLVNSGNKIMNNEIAGFGYGVASIGIGVLTKGSSGMLESYYNNNNTISGNMISNISRAGIFLGFEENSTISMNRIYNVNGQTGNEAVGIEAGRPERDGFLGFNNISLSINGNEISGVSSDVYAAGIKVLQSRFNLRDNIRGVLTFPYRSESMMVVNNAVWGITPLTANADRAGIHVLTERQAPTTGQVNYILPKEATYFSMSDKIANNTVIVTDDGGVNNTGTIAGIAIQQLKGAVLYNNAVSFEDNSVPSACPAASCLFLHGIAPKEGGVTADRNAYWNGSGKGTIARFIETDEAGTILEMGTADEFKTLDQWQLWTKAEANSVYGNFVQNLTYVGVTPMKLRVKSDPAPLGSILNNRGETLSWLKNDIDGNSRGTIGQRFDIGASEFTGKLFTQDIELVSIFEPGAYKAGSGMFSDAEYVMTEAPVNVRAYVRNNSSSMQLNVPVKVKIYRETNVNNVFNSTPVVETTVNMNIEPTETAIADYMLNNHMDPDFVPQTYNELASLGYIAPAQFSSMTANVTPRYKIELSVESDDLNANNVISKVVRFYLLKSPMKLMVSAENTNAVITSGMPTSDQIAGKLNYDNLIANMALVGWRIDLTSEPPRYDFDVLERNSWEPRSVNYSIYRSLIWSDGDDEAMTRYQRDDIKSFLASGKDKEKKNFIIGSQEVVRENQPLDKKFVNTFLRANDAPPSNPLGKGISNDGNKIRGVVIADNGIFSIKKTDYKLETGSGTILDKDPYCGLMNVYEGGIGVARAAFTYLNYSGSKSDSVMGIALSSLERNVISLGVDWRHFSNLELVLRGAVDFIEKNGGAIVAAELVDFKANQAGNNVAINWTTASEENSAMFVIEKAEQNETGRTNFVKIDEMPGAGNSTTIRHYGPVIDNKVEFGNTYVYRLKMVDKDGQFEYSSERTVTLTGQQGMVKFEGVFPNPVLENNAKIKFSLGNSMSVSIKMYDVAGKLVKVIADGRMNAGINELELNIEGIPSGVYNILLTAGEITQTKSVTIQK